MINKKVKELGCWSFVYRWEMVRSTTYLEIIPSGRKMWLVLSFPCKEAFFGPFWPTFLIFSELRRYRDPHRWILRQNTSTDHGRRHPQNSAWAVNRAKNMFFCKMFAKIFNFLQNSTRFDNRTVKPSGMQNFSQIGIIFFTIFFVVVFNFMVLFARAIEIDVC